MPETPATAIATTHKLPTNAICSIFVVVGAVVLAQSLAGFHHHSHDDRSAMMALVVVVLLLAMAAAVFVATQRGTGSGAAIPNPKPFSDLVFEVTLTGGFPSE